MKRLILILVMMIGVYAADAQTDTTEYHNNTMPTIVMIDTDYDETNSSTDISSFLQSSRDVFSNIAAYNLSSRRFRIRAYDSKYTEVVINGVMMNDPEGGRPYYSNWGGLNDAMRNVNNVTNTGLTQDGFGGPGGLTSISTRASGYRRQASISYANSNRSYNNRLMATVSTGLMDNGWAFVVSASRRWSLEGYYEGTWYDAYSYFFAAEKKLNEKHSLNLTIFGSPSSRAGSSPSVMEAFELLDNNYYNPNWGWQTDANGNQFKRNARVSSYHQPMFQLEHFWKPLEKLEINTTAYYWFGRGGSTSLDWGEAADPRPDYYRNLPSYILYQIENTSNSSGYTMNDYYQYMEDWVNDASLHQINWDSFYATNSRHLQTVENANGIAGNTITGNFSKYIVEERRQDKNVGGLVSNFKYEFNPYLHLNGGVRVGISKTHYYKKIADLLGGDYYLDIDKYAAGEPGGYTAEQQNNLLLTNHIVGVGDVFGYDYIANNNTAVLWGQLDYIFKKFNVFVGAEGSYTQMYRTGNFQNGRFPDNSLGDSEKLNFVNGSVKTGARYAVNGRNYIVANAMYKTRAPEFRSVYVAPRVRNTHVQNIDTEKILSLDLSYEYRSPFMKSRVSLYRTQFYDLTWNRSFYYEGTGKFVNYIMNDINQVAQGVEVGAEINITPTLTLQLAGNVGQNYYSNNPIVNVYEDDNAQALFENETAYLTGYYVGETPQTVGSMGLKYNAPKYWWVSLNANYFDNYYLAVNPANHTVDAFQYLQSTDENVELLLDQVKLPRAFTLDFYGGKSWKVKDYTILLNVSINNLLNNQNIILYGYEQLRSDYEDPERFPEKYAYLYGINYFVSLTIRR